MVGRAQLHRVACAAVERLHHNAVCPWSLEESALFGKQNPRSNRQAVSFPFVSYSRAIETWFYDRQPQFIIPSRNASFALDYAAVDFFNMKQQKTIDLTQVTMSVVRKPLVPSGTPELLIGKRFWSAALISILPGHNALSDSSAVLFAQS